jgi:hypothetical protein
VTEKYSNIKIKSFGAITGNYGKDLNTGKSLLKTEHRHGMEL